MDKGKVISFFDNSIQKIYTFSELSRIMKEKREEWDLPHSMNIRGFVSFLVSETKLKNYKFSFPSAKITRYSWHKPSIFELALSLKEGSYFTHQSALYIDRLIEKRPDTIYLNFEQPGKFQDDVELTQENINRAFSKPQRISKNIATVGNYKVYILNGKYTNKCGVAEVDFQGMTLRVTDLERTLIDVTVRPNYAGGVRQVLKAYKKAHSKASINKLVKYLRGINYLYPYHQVIGFYLERAGCYDKSQVALLAQFEKRFNFYLTHQMEERVFCKKWKLFYPRGL